jgi:hypothetical protein
MSLRYDIVSGVIDYWGRVFIGVERGATMLSDAQKVFIPLCNIDRVTYTTLDDMPRSAGGLQIRAYLTGGRFYIDSFKTFKVDELVGDITSVEDVALEVAAYVQEAKRIKYEPGWGCQCSK